MNSLEGKYELISVPYMFYVEVKYEFYMCYVEVKYEPYGMFQVEVQSLGTVWYFTSLLVEYTNVTDTGRNFHACIPVRDLQ